MIRGLSPFLFLELVAATPHRLPPVEQCKGDAAFDVYRAELNRVVRTRDPAALKALAASDLTVSFGGDVGWADFAKSWGLDRQPKASKLWDEMASALALGCAVAPDGGRRVMPGLFERIGDDVDIFDLVAVRAGTPLRATAGAKGRVIATLDWHAGEVQAEGSDAWTKVKLLDGRSGWVASGQLISPIGYRSVSEKRGKRWLMTAFVAGD